MARFLGTFEMKVDRKGRVSLPADFRDELPGEGRRVVYVFPSPNAPVLEAADSAYIDRLIEAVEDGADILSDAEDDPVEVLEEMRKLGLDDTGRMVLPGEFLDQAGIDGKAYFVGRGSRFQIRSEAAHAEIRAARKVRSGRVSLTLRAKDGGDA